MSFPHIYTCSLNTTRFYLPNNIKWMYISYLYCNCHATLDYSPFLHLPFIFHSIIYIYSYNWYFLLSLFIHMHWLVWNINLRIAIQWKYGAVIQTYICNIIQLNRIIILSSHHLIYRRSLCYMFTMENIRYILINTIQSITM